MEPEGPTVFLCHLKITHRIALALMAGLIAALIPAIGIARDVQDDLGGWQLEFGLDRSPFAFISPTTANVDVETIVLTCNETGRSQALQLELYPAGPLPLIPSGSTAEDLRADPHLQLSIDNRIYPVSMFFAGDRIVVADTAVGRTPGVSEALFAALRKGNELRLRFQLLPEHPGTRGHSYDGELIVELQAGRGGAALDAFRNCHPDTVEQISTAK